MNAVIMAGGKGSRFWPRSTDAKPKQFLELTASGETMLQLTYRRLRSWLPKENIYVSTSRKYAALVKEQLRELAADRLIEEPEQRDTAPGIALAALYFLNRGSDEAFVAIPSDQHIPDADALGEALRLCGEVAREERAIATLGIVPSRPETGYGYIEAEPKPYRDDVFRVMSFIEKPDASTAQSLIRRSNIYWNSGIFTWRPSTIAYYMVLHQPQMWAALTGAGEHLETVYASLPKISVDYAILEKADRIFMIPARFEWDDVGNWTALERIRGADRYGNIMEGNVEAVDSAGNIVFSDAPKTVLIGVSDLIVVSTPAGILICRKTMDQRIKSVLEKREEDADGS